MEIKATDVKKLREKTGAGMLDCKNALAKANGDFESAERLLKEQGLAAAVKKSERVTNSGMIFSKIVPDRGILLELTSETDFVARNSMFQDLGNALLTKVVEEKLTAPTEELETMVRETVGKIKENMQLRRIVTLPVGPGETLVEYVHDGRIGVMIRFSFSDVKAQDNPKVKQVLFECALHAAAFAPLFLSKDKVSQEFLKEQEQIFAKQAENLNKPANVLQGIIKGKLNKMLSEICFLEQPFVKDDKRSVAKVLEDLGKEAGAKITIVDYRYVKLGEDHS
ncbi:MAG TPA: translation elongation factor Ts [Spirochaetia bacterium]|nr:translation elongation factor Ts [Spirochaetia bacterium]